jgi:hypothetical protein
VFDPIFLVAEDMESPYASQDIAMLEQHIALLSRARTKQGFVWFWLIRVTANFVRGYFQDNYPFRNPPKKQLWTAFTELHAVLLNAPLRD